MATTQVLGFQFETTKRRFSGVNNRDGSDVYGFWETMIRRITRRSNLRKDVSCTQVSSVYVKCDL